LAVPSARSIAVPSVFTVPSCFRLTPRWYSQHTVAVRFRLTACGKNSPLTSFAVFRRLLGNYSTDSNKDIYRLCNSSKCPYDVATLKTRSNRTYEDKYPTKQNTYIKPYTTKKTFREAIKYSNI